MVLCCLSRCYFLAVLRICIFPERAPTSPLLPPLCCAGGRWDEAVEVWEEMQLRGLRPSVASHDILRLALGALSSAGSALPCSLTASLAAYLSQQRREGKEEEEEGEALSNDVVHELSSAPV